MATYEDFTTFTEVDVAADRIQKTANHIDHKAYRCETTYLYKDYGAAHFGDFTHKIKVQYVSPNSGSVGVVWALANDLGDVAALINGNKTFIYVYFYNSIGQTRIKLREVNSGTVFTDEYIGASASTWYYIKIVKSGTSLNAYIYSDSSYTTLVDTLTLTLRTNQTNRYLYGCNTLSGGSAIFIYTDIENFDIGEATVKTSSDSGTGTDTTSVYTGTPKTSSDSGTGTEQISIQRSALLSDSCSGSDILEVTYEVGWLSGYTYRVKGAVNATTAGAQTNYQLSLIIGESSGASGSDVHCNANCENFPHDVRFAKEDGETKHDYWIDTSSLTGTTPNRKLTVWIEVAAIPASGAVDFYMYYGKTSDSSESNGYNTFTFFEDFEAGEDDPNKFWLNHLGNPVFSKINGIEIFDIKKIGSTYYQYYEESVSGHWEIGYATSSDGISWSDGGIILQPTGSGWEDQDVAQPFIIYVPELDATNPYWMYYTGRGSGSNTWAIGLAKSPNGTSFTRYGLVLDKGTGWESVEVVRPFVKKIGSTYYMYYDGYNGTNTSIGYATSSNGTSWTKYGSNPVVPHGTGGDWDNGEVEHAWIVDSEDGTKWYLFYNGRQASGLWKIGWAESSLNHNSWTKNSNNPVLSDSSHHNACPVVLKISDQWRLYYFDGGTSPDWDTHLAYHTENKWLGKGDSGQIQSTTKKRGALALRVQGDDNGIYIAETNINRWLEFDYKRAGDGQWGGYKTNYRMLGSQTTSSYFLYYDSSAHDTNVSKDTDWHKIGVRLGASDTKYFIDDVEKGTTNGTPSIAELTFYAAQAGGDAYYDDIRIRKYVSPEPTWGSWGSEDALFTVVESGNGSDTTEQASQLIGTDNGSGTESVLSIEFSVPDNGQFTETLGTSGSILTFDAIGSSEDTLIEVQLQTLESGSGSDITELTADVVITDSITGQTEIPNIGFSVLDSGNLIDSIGIESNILFEDTGQITEAIDLTSNILLEDLGQSSETITLSTTCLVADTGQTDETITLSTGRLAIDTGQTDETIALSTTCLAIDTGQTDETIALLATCTAIDSASGITVTSIGLLVSDTCSSVELISTETTRAAVDQITSDDVIALTVNTQVSESGSLTEETIELSATCPITDTGQLGDIAELSGEVKFTDSASGQTEISSIGFSVLDLGNFTESSTMEAAVSLLEQSLSEDTVKLSVTRLGTDSGQSSETVGTLLGATVADTGNFTDTAITESNILWEDTCNGNETIQLDTQTIVSDVASSSESVMDLYVIGAFDVSGSSDYASIQAGSKNVSDYGNGISAVDIEVHTLSEDSGEFSENIWSTCSLEFIDSGSFTEIGFVDNECTISDTCTSVGSSSVQTLFSVTDTISSVDNVLLGEQPHVSDIGYVSDTAGLTAAVNTTDNIESSTEVPDIRFSVSDQCISTELVSTQFSLLSVDQVVSEDTIDITANIQISESGLSDDGITELTVSCSITDIAQLSETIETSGKAETTDSGSFTDVLEIESGILWSDSGSVLDSVEITSHIGCIDTVNTSENITNVGSTGSTDCSTSEDNAYAQKVVLSTETVGSLSVTNVLVSGTTEDLGQFIETSTVTGNLSVLDESIGHTVVRWEFGIYHKVNKSIVVSLVSKSTNIRFKRRRVRMR